MSNIDERVIKDVKGAETYETDLLKAGRSSEHASYVIMRGDQEAGRYPFNVSNYDEVRREWQRVMIDYSHKGPDFVTLVARLNESQ